MKLPVTPPSSLKKRELLVSRVVQEGWSLAKAAEAAEVGDRRAREWVRRFRAEGKPGLYDRSSALKRVHNLGLAFTD